MEKTKESKEAEAKMENEMAEKEYNDVIQFSNEQRSIIVDALVCRMSNKVKKMEEIMKIDLPFSEVRFQIVNKLTQDVTKTAEVLDMMVSEFTGCDGDCDNCPIACDDDDEEDENDESEG